MKNSLKKLYESFSNTIFFEFFQDIVAQSLLFAGAALGLTFWCLLEARELTSGYAIIMSVIAIIAFACLFLLIYKKRFLISFSFSLLITSFGLYVLYFWFNESLVWAVFCFLIPVCNIFVWHFQNKRDGREKISMRIFVLLTNNTLTSLIFTWDLSYFTECEIVFAPLFFFCTTMAYVFFRILYERKNLSAKGCQKDTTICNKRSTSYYDAILNVYYVLYVVFFSAILTGITANDLYISRHYDSLIDQAPEYIEAHTLALYFAILYFLLWGTSIIANSRNLFSKICTAFSAIAFIPVWLGTINHIKKHHINLEFDYIVNSCYEMVEILNHQKNIDIIHVTTIFGILFAIICVLIVFSHFYNRKELLESKNYGNQLKETESNHKLTEEHNQQKIEQAHCNKQTAFALPFSANQSSTTNTTLS